MRFKHISIKTKLMLKKFILDLRQTHLKDLRNQILLYFKKMPELVHLRNLIIVSTILSVVMIVMFAQDFAELPAFSKESKPKNGGTYNEGVIGNIDKINPLFTATDAEASANRLVFSGLTRVMPDNEVVGDLAESWQETDGGRAYIFKIRSGVLWHDGEPFTADDVVFTINLIKNPDTRALQSQVWQGVEVEKIGDQEVKIKLPNSYNNFLKVASQPILPVHLLRDVSPQNIKVAEFNTSPVGTGPYKFLRFDQAGNETEVVFSANEQYLPHRPYINTVKLRIYPSFEQLYNGLLRKQIDAINQIPFSKIEDVEKKGSFKLYQYYLPRYRLLALNLKNPLLADKEMRKMIQDSINRDEIIDDAVDGKAMPVYAPILPGKEGYDPTLRTNSYNPTAVNQALDKAGWIKGANGIRAKDGKELSFRLAIINEEENRKAAKILEKQLKNNGIKLDVNVSESNLFQADYLRPRNFDIALLGQNLGQEADIYSFWHSSQVTDPGLNITGFKDRKIDKLLEQIRKSKDEKYREERYREIQKTIVSEIPAIYLYNPIYTIGFSDTIKGYYTGKIAQPIDHLNNIFEWYIKEE